MLLLATEDWYVVSHRLPVIRAARAAGFNVVVATRVQDHRTPIEEAGAQVIPVSLARSSRNPWREAATVRQLIKIYRTVRPSLVHHVGVKPILYGGWAARAAGVRHVIQAFAGLGTLYAESQQQRVKRTVFETLVRPVTRQKRTVVLVQNEADSLTLVARGLSRPDAIHVIRGSGVDLTRFHPMPEPVGHPVVLMPSRLLRDKGVREFVAAARLLRGRARFVLAGAVDTANPSAIAESELREWTTEGVVEAWGHQTDMPSVLAQSNVVVLPSYREGLPKALLEAAAVGRAIVTTRTAGCSDVVTDGENGLLVPVKDVASLATAIVALLDDPELRHQMGQRGRTMVERDFSDSYVGAAHVDLYRKVLQ